MLFPGSFPKKTITPILYLPTLFANETENSQDQAQELQDNIRPSKLLNMDV